MEYKKKAVALKYDRAKDNAPKVKAKGEGEIAKNIIKIATENDIPIREDADLVELLAKVEVDREIPPNLYKAVAEVFSFLYKMTHDKDKLWVYEKFGKGKLTLKKTCDNILFYFTIDSLLCDIILQNKIIKGGRYETIGDIGISSNARTRNGC